MLAHNNNIITGAKASGFLPSLPTGSSLRLEPLGRVHGELPFKQRLAVQTIRGSGFASGNSQGWLVEGLGRPLSPRACRRIALGVHAPRCRTF